MNSYDLAYSPGGPISNRIWDVGHINVGLPLQHLDRDVESLWGAPVAAGHARLLQPAEIVQGTPMLPNARFLPLPLPPVRPDISATVPHFVQTIRDPKRWHTHLTGPPIRVEDHLVVAGEARYGEQAHAVGLFPHRSRRRNRHQNHRRERTWPHRDRTYTASSVVDWILSGRSYPGQPRFADIKTIVKVLARAEYANRCTFDTHYYICSAPLDIERIARGARGHWGVESMHWLLDVEFKDDLSRYRTGHGAKNMAIVRRFALGLVRAEKSKGSVKTRRKIASWNPDFLLQILQLK